MANKVCKVKCVFNTLTYIVHFNLLLLSALFDRTIMQVCTVKDICKKLVLLSLDILHFELQPVLFSYFRSSATWRVRTGNELG